MTVRYADPEEVDAVVGFLEGVARRLAQRVIGDRAIGVLDERDPPRVVLLSPGLDRLPTDLVADSHAGGLPIGTLEDGVFRLDLQGAVLLARHTEVQGVRVREKAARLFLYGRDILGDSVLRADRRLQNGDACVVLNPRGEALGIGEVVGGFKGLRPAVRPLHDLGVYLREQG